MSHWTSKSISTAYSAFRPTYPAELFERILQRVPATNRGKHIDIGCGTGQALQGLAPHFEHCIGVDPSLSQIESATKIPNVRYVIGGAENFSIPEDVHGGGAAAWKGKVDLITVAQAMHWFDLPKFLAHIDSLLAPGGVFAVWIYGSAALDPKPCQDLWGGFDRLMLRSGYWPPGRKHIDDHYANLLPQVSRVLGQPIGRDLIAPWREISIRDFGNYMSTMSGVNNYIKMTGHSTVVADYEKHFAQALVHGNSDHESEAEEKVRYQQQMTEEGGASLAAKYAPENLKMNIRHDFLLWTFQKKKARAFGADSKL